MNHRITYVIIPCFPIRNVHTILIILYLGYTTKRKDKKLRKCYMRNNDHGNAFAVPQLKTGSGIFTSQYIRHWQRLAVFFSALHGQNNVEMCFASRVLGELSERPHKYCVVSRCTNTICLSRIYFLISYSVFRNNIFLM